MPRPREIRQSYRCSQRRATGTLAQEIPQLIVERVEMMLQRLHYLHAVEGSSVVRTQHHDRKPFDDGRQLFLKPGQRAGGADVAQSGRRVSDKADGTGPIPASFGDQSFEVLDPFVNAYPADGHQHEKAVLDGGRDVDL